MGNSQPIGLPIGKILVMGSLRAAQLQMEAGCLYQAKGLLNGAAQCNLEGLKASENCGKW